jgi:hypothetical protein
MGIVSRLIAPQVVRVVLAFTQTVSGAGTVRVIDRRASKEIDICEPCRPTIPA